MSWSLVSSQGTTTFNNPTAGGNRQGVYGSYRFKPVISSTGLPLVSMGFREPLKIMVKAVATSKTELQNLEADFISNFGYVGQLTTDLITNIDVVWTSFNVDRINQSGNQYLSEYTCEFLDFSTQSA